MGNIIFAGVIAFLAIMTAVGYVRGLVKTVFSLVSVIVILVVVTILTPTARTIIRETPLYPYIQDRAREFTYNSMKIEEWDTTNVDNPIAGLGIGEQEKIINELPIPQNIKDSLISNNTEEGYKVLEVTNFADYIVMSITDMIINSIAFIILFAVVVIAIKTAVALLDIISKLPVLNFLNKSGGAVFGFVEALIIIWIVCIIVTAFAATQWGQQLLAEINDNVFLSLIYSNNILEKIVMAWLN